MDGDFAIDLFGELARAYLAAVNTRSQVILIPKMFVIGMLIEMYYRIVVLLPFKSYYQYLIVQILMKKGRVFLTNCCIYNFSCS